MTYTLDDTQPRAPFGDEPLDLKPTILPDDENPPPRSRGGCLLNGLIIGLFVLVALAIVGLSAAAGWTSGQREANVHATATRAGQINEQLQHVPSDIVDGNLAMLDIRLRWLATQTPGIPGVSDLMATATALYQTAQPTATLPVTPTPEATLEAAATDAVAIAPDSSGGYDLAQILAQAESAMASSQWQDAIDLLDVVIGIDSTYETNRVRTFMSQSLNSYARELYNAMQPAAANLIVSRARDFGPLAEGIEYENMAAELYLTARAGGGVGSPAAINALQRLLNLGPGRYYAEAQTLLYNSYVNSGDAYMVQGDSCSAVGQYQNAINLQSSGSANGKRAAAQTACDNATPTPDPNIALPPDGQVAPVGQVVPPGQ
ncbi:MAG: hypothetical protein ABI835_00065 [Chloroflexota bacterium]